jgi:hypothetical protein
MDLQRSFLLFLFTLLQFSGQCFSFEKPAGYSLRVESAYAFHGDQNERFQSGPSIAGSTDINQNNRIEVELSHLFFDIGVDSLHQAYRYYFLSLRWIYAFKDGKVGVGYTVSPATYYAVDFTSVPNSLIRRNSIGLAGVDFILSTHRELSSATLSGRIFTTDTRSRGTDWINYFAQARFDRIVNRLVTVNCALQYWQYKNLISKYYHEYYYSNLETSRDYYGTYRTRFFLIPSIELNWRKCSLQAGPVFNLLHYSAIEDKVSWQGSFGYTWQ